MPPAVATWTVDRALGPATATLGIPSSFGTHVVLDCLSRPVGLTIPWWKRGTVPWGIGDPRPVHGARHGPISRPMAVAIVVTRRPRLNEKTLISEPRFSTGREDVGRFFLLIVGLRGARPRSGSVDPTSAPLRQGGGLGGATDYARKSWVTVDRGNGGAQPMRERIACNGQVLHPRSEIPRFSSSAAEKRTDTATVTRTTW